MKEVKKVIHYYYDKAGNRRPLDVQINEGYDLMVESHFIDSFLKENPHLRNNFYALVDGIEFKLD
ncbi:hypothetical protein [Mammaliicoccus vitulinus]|uniref:Phage protein n=2 Tax=Mammaliicoccus vitulinus TaxID=71237 RepID=A0ABX7HEW1_9STAP|nr:hypothetical protein [Mammaliicoccus vitulinus]PNZ40935.1 hypothetical protein CD107_01025 [Mammaliicoccus vitulinus]QRO85160.1 hypothetical protein I6J37_00190 [Mammaliicoccus vitulinus]